MKRFSKILSIGLSAVMLISGSSVLAGAATYKNAVYCSGADCKNVQYIIDQIKNGNCCDWSVLQKISGGYCPDGNCSVDKPSLEPAQQSEAPAVTPTEQPTKPVAEVVKPQDSAFNAAYEAEVVRLVNAERAKYGLAALTQDDGAQNVAHVRAKEIVQSFSHTRPDGRSCFTAASDLGVTYRSAGENIAYGYATPAQVVNGWMNSEGHRKNILSASYTKIGVGSYSANGVMYWSQFFIG